MSYYPIAVHDIEPPTLDWPGATEPLTDFQKELEWRAAGSPGFSISPQGTPVDGLPEGVEEGRVGRLVPVWVARSGESWWTVDATTGSIFSGSLAARPSASAARLAFFSGLALFISFFGGSILFRVLSLLTLAMPRVLGPKLGVVLALLGGLAGLIWLGLRLLRVLPFMLYEPVRRVQTGQIEIPLQRESLGMVNACSYLTAFIAFASLYAAVSFTASGRGTMVLLLINICQAGLAIYLTHQCRKLGQGYAFVTSKDSALEGALGDLVAVGIRITLFAIAGQIFGALLGVAGVVPSWDVNWYILQGAQIGALLGVATASISWAERGMLLAGLIGKASGEAIAGNWLALLMALGAVSVPGLWKAFQAKGEQRRLDLIQSMRESWAFTFGLAVGRLVGRTVGLFFLGMGGMALGEILAEQLAGVTGLMSQRQQQSETEIVPSG